MARLLRLEKMEVLGFKSFYGRTRFEFPEGITGVVGPNGCGKSNIGDAISWVLGEQRASLLRSDRMEDVIFNGSEGRKPLGMAEVSLTFRGIEAASGNGHGEAGPGNGNGSGEAEFAAADDGAGRDAALETDRPIATAHELEGGPVFEPGAGAPSDGEVVVTRRLFRSGESEYSLNGRRCRLKDLQELLARTRIGTRLYTTIEQGKIDQILSSKPKERRAIIEEAAGILGYRGKRRQAEQKLEATQANLLRLSDIVGEVDKQIQSLKRQASKARRYRRLQEELRERRAALVHRRLLAVDAERAAALGASEDLRRRETAGSADLARAEADLETIRLRLETGETEARRRREAIHALDLEIDHLQARGRAGEEQGRDLQARIGDAEREIEALETRARTLHERTAGLRAAIADEETLAGGAGRDLEAAERERVRAAASIAAAETRLAEMRDDLLRALDAASAAARERAEIEERARSADAALGRLERQAAEAASTRAALAREIAALEGRAAAAQGERDERARERGQAAAGEQAASRDLLLLERRAEEIRGRAGALAERLAALREMERRHAGYGRGVAEVLEGAAGFAPQGVVGERLVVPRGLERAVAAALGGLLEAVIVARREEAVLGVRHLRRAAAGRIAFVESAGPGERALPPLPPAASGHPGVEGRLIDRVGGAAAPAVARALGGTLLVRDLETALALAPLCPGWSVVTPDGDLAREDGSLVGGDGQALEQGVLARRAEIETLAERSAEAGRALQEAETGLGPRRAELEAARERVERAGRALQDSDRDALESDLRLLAKRAEAQRLDATLPLLAGEAERLRRERDERTGQAGRLAAEVTAGEERRRTLEAEIQRASEDLAARRASAAGAEEGVAGARAAAAATAERLAAQRRELAGAEEAVRELGGRLAERAAAREEWRSRLTEIAAARDGLAGPVDRALQARAEESARDESAAAGLAYDRSLLHAREQAARESRAALDPVRRELQERERLLARLDADLEHLERSCREDLQTTGEALRATPPPGADRTLAEEEAAMAALRADLEAIGAVNLMAIEQSAELEERHGYLSTQKRDLEESIASLREAIRRIDRESRERFLEAFGAIQEGFEKSFTTLFGGGRAAVRLQEGEDDVLDAGIEIVAQPPGKRLQSLALLSGGEKALTAVALLFALFRYRPSPFCVLDEVDAPLDEANVERFTNLLRDLREETQFILITHNRKSMEAADLLYGVTMEEPGVSKVLPLRLE